MALPACSSQSHAHVSHVPLRHLHGRAPLPLVLFMCHHPLTLPGVILNLKLTSPHLPLPVVTLLLIPSCYQMPSSSAHANHVPPYIVVLPCWQPSSCQLSSSPILKLWSLPCLFPLSRSHLLILLSCEVPILPDHELTCPTSTPHSFPDGRVTCFLGSKYQCFLEASVTFFLEASGFLEASVTCCQKQKGRAGGG